MEKKIAVIGDDAVSAEIKEKLTQAGLEVSVTDGLPEDILGIGASKSATMLEERKAAAMTRVQKRREILAWNQRVENERQAKKAAKEGNGKQPKNTHRRMQEMRRYIG